MYEEKKEKDVSERSSANKECDPLMNPSIVNRYLILTAIKSPKQTWKEV